MKKILLVLVSFILLIALVTESTSTFNTNVEKFNIAFINFGDDILTCAVFYGYVMDVPKFNKHSPELKKSYKRFLEMAVYIFQKANLSDEKIKTKFRIKMEYLAELIDGSLDNIDILMDKYAYTCIDLSEESNFRAKLGQRLKEVGLGK